MTQRATLVGALALAIISAPLAHAQTTTLRPSPADSTRRAQEDLEQRAKLARRDGGLRIGAWDAHEPSMPSGVQQSATPSFEGYVRKGLDLHLAWENSVGFWRLRQTSNTSGGPLGGGTSESRLDAYVIPQYTSLLFYPFTRPTQHLEPYIRGGLGFTVGIEDNSGSSGGLVSTGSGMNFVPGFGATGGLGLEWRPAQALGLAISGRYQWIRFFQDFAGQQTYEGLEGDIGVTYRFQYR